MSAVLAGGAAVILLLSPDGRRAVGVPIEPFITPAHVVAMKKLEAPILGVPLVVESGRTQADHRYNEVMRGLHGSRGFAVVGRESYPNLTNGDGAVILTALLAAAEAGVKAGGYRLTNLGLFDFGPAGKVDVPAIALSVFEGKRPTHNIGPVPLTQLGAAVLAAAQERNRLFQTSLVPMGAHRPRFDEIAARLAIEMDAVGYIASGKPPPDPTVLGGLAAAGHAVGSFVTGIAGDAIGGVAAAVVGSPVFWFAGLAIVAFTVLR